MKSKSGFTRTDGKGFEQQTISRAMDFTSVTTQHTGDDSWSLNFQSKSQKTSTPQSLTKLEASVNDDLL